MIQKYKNNCIVSYFRGVLIFIIFMINPDVTKFFTHKSFNPHYSTLV